MRICPGKRPELVENAEPFPLGKAQIPTKGSIARIRKKSTEKWPQSEWDFAAEPGDWKRNGNTAWTEGKVRYQSAAKRDIGKKTALNRNNLT